MESYATDVPEAAYKTLTFRNTYVLRDACTLYKGGLVHPQGAEWS